MRFIDGFVSIKTSQRRVTAKKLSGKIVTGPPVGMPGTGMLTVP